jgi:hypothetical protein
MPIFEKKVGGVHRGNWSLRKLVPDFDHIRKLKKRLWDGFAKMGEKV